MVGAKLNMWCLQPPLNHSNIKKRSASVRSFESPNVYKDSYFYIQYLILANKCALCSQVTCYRNYIKKRTFANQQFIIWCFIKLKIDVREGLKWKKGRKAFVEHCIRIRKRRLLIPNYFTKQIWIFFSQSHLIFRESIRLHTIY